ncbi:Hypothetical protein POVN_LOCUS291 [uncultured virus]|nr:Hypothetical protein POVN_LOCUS291 [uncultured virus]
MTSTSEQKGKQRQAVTHVVSWEEFKKELSWLKDQGKDYEYLREDEGTQEHPFDLVWSELARLPSLEVGRALKSIVRSRYVDCLARKVSPGATLKRGDCVRMDFIKHNHQGVYFYDGKEVIPPDCNDEGWCVPAVFKVPTEFSPNYWRTSAFTSASDGGNLHFDAKGFFDAKETPTFQRLGRIGDAMWFLTQHKGYTFFIGTLKGKPEASWETFFQSGLCHAPEYSGALFELSVMGVLLKEAKLPALADLDYKFVVIT